MATTKKVAKKAVRKVVKKAVVRKTAQQRSRKTQRPSVAIVMGSASDWEVMREVGAILDEAGVSHVSRILSAHRTPAPLRDFISRAEKEGCSVFVAGAGLAAHLAGAVAAQTTRPVIGVPLEGGPLRGMDSLLSTVQMPAGVPVACTAIGKHGARNAGWLAAQILSLSDPALATRLRQLRQKQGNAVLQQDRKLGKD